MRRFGPRSRVVIADDSPSVRRLVESYLASEADFEIVGRAEDGAQAIEMVRRLRPDALTLDLEMPGVDGLQALVTIMREAPTATIVVSGVSGRAATRTLQALDAGAVDFVLKFDPKTPTDPEALRREIVAKVRAAARLRVIRTVGERLVRLDPLGAGAPTAARGGGLASFPARGGLVVIGASTGGPVALRELLAELPADFDASMLIVQHLPQSFTSVLAAQLDRTAKIRVREALDGDLLEPGTALVAPGGYHLLVRRDGRVEMLRGPEIGGHCPSIDVTMQSAAKVYGARVRGVVLSGMGDDGAEGLFAIRARG